MPYTIEPPSAKYTIEPPPEDPHTTVGGLAAAAGRGLAPIAAGAGLGAAAGAPFAGVGAIPGAVAGAGAAGLAEAGVPAYNFLARHTGLPESPTPSELTDKLLDALGVKRPSTSAERMTETVAGDIGAALGGARPAVRTPLETRTSLEATAGKLAGNEEKAAALRETLDKAAPGADKSVRDRLANHFVSTVAGAGVEHFLMTGDPTALVAAVGIGGGKTLARQLYQWWQTPTRRLAQLEKIIERQRRIVAPFSKGVTGE
jgi:hypothetical protein